MLIQLVPYLSSIILEVFRLQQEKPTNCGTKAADVLPIFLAGKLYNANQLNILVYLQLL